MKNKETPILKKPEGGTEMDKKSQPLVSKEMIYVCLAFVGLIIILIVLGSTQWGLTEMFQLWIMGFKSLF